MRMDAAEALTNAVIGFCISLAATVYVLGYSYTGGVAVTAMFFALSFLRAFVMRRIFRKLAANKAT